MTAESQKAVSPYPLREFTPLWLPVDDKHDIKHREVSVHGYPCKRWWHPCIPSGHGFSCLWGISKLWSQTYIYITYSLYSIHPLFSCLLITFIHVWKLWPHIIRKYMNTCTWYQPLNSSNEGCPCFQESNINRFILLIKCNVNCYCIIVLSGGTLQESYLAPGATCLTRPVVATTPRDQDILTLDTNERGDHQKHHCIPSIHCSSNMHVTYINMYICKLWSHTHTHITHWISSCVGSPWLRWLHHCFLSNTILSMIPRGDRIHPCIQIFYSSSCFLVWYACDDHDGQ